MCGVVGDFITRTFRALEESVGSKVVRKNFTRKWYNEEIRGLVKERREAYAQFRLSGKDVDWREYITRRKKCKQAIRMKKRQLWEQYLAEMES